ncbi:MAG: epoxyqueuosine reductase QueH [Deltaproteobacteria bacterium]|nr:epoxyqueuosine reductase QueH [Deltaproteobacteria bacterium]
MKGVFEAENLAINSASPEPDPQKRPASILVHACCGPCSIIPLKTLLKGEAQVSGFFYNPNIHPYSEFKKRLEAVKTLAGYLSVDVICNDDYRPSGFINGMKASVSPGLRYPQKGERCSYCYLVRLEETAKAAKANGFDAFSSSLLYSKYQDHEEVKRLGVDLGEKYGIIFYYEDFRAFWQEGVEESRNMGLYRQKYCGCIYSRLERHSEKNKARKAVAG